MVDCDEDSPSAPSPPPRLTVHRNRLWRRISPPPAVEAQIRPSEATRAVPAPARVQDGRQARKVSTAVPARASVEQPERVVPVAGPSRQTGNAHPSDHAESAKDARSRARIASKSSLTARTGFEALVRPAPKLLKPVERAPTNRYKTSARRLGPPPDGKWAASTLHKLASEASRGRDAEQGDASSSGDEDEVEQLEQLPGSVQEVYATLIPRTASKMLARSHSRRTQPSRSRRSRAEVPNSSDDRLTGGARTLTSVAQDDPPTNRASSSPADAPDPTHHFAGSRSVSKLSAKAKSQYLRRTATGRRVPLDMQDFVASINQQLQISDEDEENDGDQASYEGDSDDLYEPGPPPKPDAKTKRGKKRHRKWVDTPATGAVKRLKVGAAARGNFLNGVKETGFSPLLARTPKSAPSRMRSISVIEKSIDRSIDKKRVQRSDEQQPGRRVRSLAMVPAEEAGAVAGLPASLAFAVFAPRGVMPEPSPLPPTAPAKASSARKKPAQQRIGTKSRFRYIPARLPPPQRLASLRLAQAATKENLRSSNSDGQLEKADDDASPRMRSDHRFRFATGPGAKRAPTVMYGFATSLMSQHEHEERRSPESPIRSDHFAARFGYSDVEPCDDPPHATASSFTRGGVDPPAATGGRKEPVAPHADITAAGISDDGPAAQPSASRFPLAAHVKEKEPTVLVPPTSQARPDESVALAADQAHFAQPNIVPDSQGALSTELSLPVPAGKRKLLSGYSSAGRDNSGPVSPELYAETSSSASSGIWSRLPSQFDHRFGLAAASAASNAQYVEVPSTGSLIEAAYADADEPFYFFEPPYQAHSLPVGRAGQSLPASFEL